MPQQLTPQEKQEVVRFLEADKPLPEKYRFLLFEDKREIELVWNGKSNDVTNVVLPFQVIEQVDEPRSEQPASLQLDIFDLDSRRRQLQGWTNKLIWGDNKLILPSLKNGPLREEIDRQGGLKLIYIDPPFDVGADFSMEIEIGEETFTKKPNILEEIAYRDTWGKGNDSFLAMIYERLLVMRDLLAEDGSIYVHCDWRVSGIMRMILDEVFGSERFVNEIAWCYSNSGRSQKFFPRKHDTIFFYSKSENFNFNPVRIPVQEHIREQFPLYEEETGKYYRLASRGAAGTYKEYAEKMVEDWWIDINSIGGRNKTERLDYPTQKPEALLERILLASTNEGDLVADFFCGSGTTMAAAEKLGRKWIAADLGKFSIHTTRKRMISVQRELKAKGKPYRAFEILNLGKYERQHYIGVNQDLRAEAQSLQIKEREQQFIELILNAYRAEAVSGYRTFQGKKSGRLVAIGPVNIPVTRLFIEEIILECRKNGLTQVDVLGFEFEMGLFPNILEEARSKGIDIAPKHIPAEVFDKKAVAKGQVTFYDVAAIEVTPHIKKNMVAIELDDFSVFYSQDSSAESESEMKDKTNRIIVERGQIVKVVKDKEGIVTKEVLTKKWTDWIDYWAVDFNFESKREILRVRNTETDEWEDVWTGDFVFENEWQSFRTKQNRELELKSVPHECPPGRRKIAIKVVDIFGNDTMKIIDVNIEGGK